MIFIKNGRSPWLASISPQPNEAELNAIFLRLLANGITLALPVHCGLASVGKPVNMGGYQVVNRPSILQNVLEIMNSKRNLIGKYQVQIRATAVKSGFSGWYHKLSAKPDK